SARRKFVTYYVTNFFGGLGLGLGVFDVQLNLAGFADRAFSTTVRRHPFHSMKLRSLFIALIALPVALVAAEVAKISPTEAAKLVADGKAVLVDVREPAEWSETGVAAPAALLPMSDFNGDQKLWKPFLEKNAGKQLILYCRSGNRSGQVAEKLVAAGKSVANSGAFKDWEAAGLPTRKVEK
ncbi:MAG: rhodanese-like domain-containing protein, partial [Opitutaceae bacterium]